jgi:hypothetical protein
MTFLMTFRFSFKNDLFVKVTREALLLIACLIVFLFKLTNIQGVRQQPHPDHYKTTPGECARNLIQCTTALQLLSKPTAVLSVKRHSKLTKIIFRGIPIVQEYCYLGVTVDDHRSISSHLEWVVQRSSYLRANMKFHMLFLNFENQYLIWAIYVWPILHVRGSALVETDLSNSFMRCGGCRSSAF